MDETDPQLDTLAFPWRILSLIGIALAAHLLVMGIRYAAQRISHGAAGRRSRYRKLQSLATLVGSIAVFTVYFLMTGFILSELGVSLAAYLASASVVGLAVGFGSQGVVQDVVTGLTLIFSDLIDVGDMVEVSGQTGVVRGITMRFVELENALGGAVFIPNRTIASVINYPRGYVRCLVDVTLAGDARQRQAIEQTAIDLMHGFYQQFPGISWTAPSVEARMRLQGGKELLRLKFRIWPNRGGPIEAIFKQELAETLKRDYPEYQPWMIAVSYEVELRIRRAERPLPWLLRARRGDAPAPSVTATGGDNSRG